jgi:hypothetical protein
MIRTPGGLLSRAAAVARGAREHLPGIHAALRTPVRRARSRTTVVVDLPDAATVTVARTEAVPGRLRTTRTTRAARAARETENVRRSLDLTDTGAPADTGEAERVAGRVIVTVGDPAVLVRLACSGLLVGSVDRVRVLVRWSPAWLRAGAPGVRPGGTLTDLAIRVRGRGVEVALAWSTPVPIGFALDEVLRVVLRTRTTPRHDGPLPALDRAGWQAAAWTWPDGVVLDDRPPPVSAGPGPLAPFTDPVAFLDDPTAGAPTPAPLLVGAVAFPWRRKLLGEPADYRLIRLPAGHLAVTAHRGGRPVAVFDGTRGVERVVTANSLTRYATVTIEDDVLPEASSVGVGAADDTVLLALAAVGVVPVPLGGRGRDRLAALGLPCPQAADEVRGPEGYAWSAAVSRAAGIAVDPVLRRRLGPAAGNGAGVGAGVGAAGPALPTVTVVIASMRPDTVSAVLADLAAQTWPDFEVVLGTHGWTAAPDAAQRWSELVGRPVRVTAAEPGDSFGQVLGRLSRIADGDLLTKVDDDDVYGPDHLTDLVLALRTSGADLVSKAPRFVHLAAGGADPRVGGTGRTVDRSWAASEVLDTTPAGGTLLFARSTLLTAGGWSGSIRHVDIDVTARIRRAGGVTYRSHGLGYTYVRHEGGHTWEVDRALFLEQAGEVYDGLPLALAVGRPEALRRDLPGWAAGPTP